MWPIDLGTEDVEFFFPPFRIPPCNPLCPEYFIAWQDIVLRKFTIVFCFLAAGKSQGSECQCVMALISFINKTKQNKTKKNIY